MRAPRQSAGSITLVFSGKSMKTLTRRRFVCYCAGSAGLTACGGGGSDSKPTTAVEPQQADIGCALFSTALGAGTGCNQLLSSSGSLYDSQIQSEFQAQRTFFQLPAVSLRFLNDCTPNAYADPNSKSILLGVNLINQTLNAYRTQSDAFFTLLPLYAVLAHEFGHQLQFEFGWMNRSDGVVQEELEADMWAGFYVGLRGLFSGYQVSQTIEQFYRIGSDDFFNPNWHGTSYQRANAFADGIWAAKEYNENKIGRTFGAIRARLQELVTVELRYQNDLSSGYVSKSDIRQQCDRFKVGGTYQNCGALLGWPYDTLPGP